MEKHDPKSGLHRILFFAIIILAAFLVSKYYFQLMLIRGDSMNPAYHNMQLTILDKHSKNYDYGDVISFRCDALKEVLVKRIAAMPGDTVQIRDGTLYVNGEKSSVYPDEGIFEYAGIAADEICLAEGQFFVIGDNIAKSKDSRYEAVGIIGEDSIVGKICANGRK